MSPWPTMPGKRIRPSSRSQSVPWMASRSCGGEQAPGHDHEACADEHRGQERPRVHVGVARPLAQQEVAGEHQQVEHREQVALERRAFGARTGDHHDHAGERQRRRTRAPRRLRRSPNMRVASIRIRTGCNAGMSVAFTIEVSLERREPEDEAEREAHAGGNAASTRRRVMRPPIRYANGDRDGGADGDAPEHDGRRRGVDALHEERARIPTRTPPARRPAAAARPAGAARSSA